VPFYVFVSSNFTSHSLYRLKHFKQYKQTYKMKFTHPALLALLSTATAIPFFQAQTTLSLAGREAAHPTTPTNFPSFTMPMGTGFDGSPAFPTGTGMTPHHGGDGGHGKPSGSDKHHSKAPHPLPTKSKPMNLPRQFPTEFPTGTPPSWGSWPTEGGSWPTGVNSGGDNGAGFGGGGASPSGWFPKRANHPRGGYS
jgi:hypothetical protein